MRQEIMSDVSDYIAAYESYKNSVEKKSLFNKLTVVYNELLDIAEKNADDYEKFRTALKDKKIDKRFKKEINKCNKVFKKHLLINTS